MATLRQSTPTACVIDGDRARGDRRFMVGCAVITIIGAVLRTLGARGDLWADEIWSLDVAKEAQTPWALITLLTDNNHLLNTFVMYFLRDSQNMFAFRVHSIIAGTGTVILAGVFARRWGRPATLFTMLLAACSFVLVHYGSEARGYSMLVFFFLAAAIVLERGLTRPTWRGAVLFWICCGLGTLAHSLFVQGYVALASWSAWRFVASRRRWRAAHEQQAAHVSPTGTCAWSFAAMAMYHAVPVCIIGVLYFAFMRHLGVMGATTSPAWEMICQTAAFALGVPFTDGWDAAAVVLWTIILAVGTTMLIRMRDDRWVLLLTAAILAPALLVLLSSPAFLLARYFIIPITVVQITLGFLLGRLWNAGGSGRLASLLAVVLVLLGNGADTFELLKNGRGQYSKAMRYIAEHATDSVIRISGDHDRRQSTIVRFFGPREITQKSLEYVSGKLLTFDSPEWVLMHTWGDEPSKGQSLTFDKIHRYELRAAFPASPLGGWNCLVYQRAGPVTPPTTSPVSP